LYGRLHRETDEHAKEGLALNIHSFTYLWDVERWFHSRPFRFFFVSHEMMRQRVALGALFFGIQYALVQAQAVWKSPLKTDVEANAKDTVLLDWRFPADADEPTLSMWCGNDTDRTFANLGS
jgi:hypothetical protein